MGLKCVFMANNELMRSFNESDLWNTLVPVLLASP